MLDCDDDDLFVEALEKAEKIEAEKLAFLSTPPDSKVLNTIGLVKRNESSPLTSIGNSEFNITSSGSVKRKIEPNNTSCSIYPKVIKPLPEACLSNNIHGPSSDSTKNTGKPNHNFGLDQTKISSIYIPKSSVSYSPVSSIIRKRKFPGPAGLLPQLGFNEFHSSQLNVLENEDSTVKTSETSLCSQASAQDFVSGPWKRMLTDLDDAGISSINLFRTNNIKWIQRRATLRGPASIKKITFIVVMVRTIDLSHLDAIAVFQDETGQVNGTISKGVMEQFSEHISSGTVLILRDVTILSPSSFQSGMRMIGQLKKHYLNITLNSVVSIYSLDNSERVKKVERIKLTKDIVRFLSDPEVGRERIEVIENEETAENNEEVSLFDSVTSPKESTPRPLLNKRSLPNYKTPANSPKSHFVPKPTSVVQDSQDSFRIPAKLSSNISKSTTPNLPSVNNPKPHFVPKQNQASQDSFRIPANVCSNVSKSTSPNLSATSRLSTPNPPLPVKHQFKFNSVPENRTSAKSLPYPVESSLSSFADGDDELDLLLATIDTDSL